MKQLPKTDNPTVVRTDFENQPAWDAICKLLRAPADHESGLTFYANLDFLEDSEFRNLTREELLEMVPQDYDHQFLFVVDNVAMAHPEFAILVVELIDPRGRSFRTIPPQVQGIENNLSIANMDFQEFAEAVDTDGIFRGFRKP